MPLPAGPCRPGLHLFCDLHHHRFLEVLSDSQSGERPQSQPAALFISLKVLVNLERVLDVEPVYLTHICVPSDGQDQCTESGNCV